VGGAGRKRAAKGGARRGQTRLMKDKGHCGAIISATRHTAISACRRLAQWNNSE